MRKEKLRKVGLCFITPCLIKPFKVIINFSSIGLFDHNIYFLFHKPIRSAVLTFLYRDDAGNIKGKIGNGRSSRPEVFRKNGVLKKNSRNSKILRPATLFKGRHRCFPVNFVKFLRNFFIKYLWWLLLE